MAIPWRVRATVHALLLTSCATASVPGAMTTPSASTAGAKPLTPLVIGWEQFFTIDWQAGERRGRPVVYGHIYNRWGRTAAGVRLLVEGLDGAGQVTEQQVGWLGFELTPGTTAPFAVGVPEPAPAYRVSVFAFDWVERGRGQRP